jgi:hypothetical protein
MDRTNAERQRRYIERLKARAEGHLTNEQVLQALRRKKPSRFLNGTLEPFVAALRAEADRLSAPQPKKRKRR